MADFLHVQRYKKTACYHGRYTNITVAYECRTSHKQDLLTTQGEAPAAAGNSQVVKDKGIILHCVTKQSPYTMGDSQNRREETKWRM